MRRAVLGVVLAAAAAAANADMALAYHGKLVATGGHAKISTTQDFYVHALKDADQKASATMSRVSTVLTVRYGCCGRRD